MLPVDNGVPKGIDLEEDHPQGKSLMPRFLYVAGGIVAIMLAFAIWSLWRSATKSEQEEKVKLNQQMAPEAQPSSRKEIQSAEPEAQNPGLTSSEAAYAATPAKSPLSAMSPLPVQPATHPELAYQPVGAYQERQISPEEQALAGEAKQAKLEEKRAREAPSTVRLAAAPANPGAASGATEENSLAALLAAQQPAAGNDLNALASRFMPRQSTGVNYAEQNGQEQKRQFLEESKDPAPADNYLNASRISPMSPFELMQGDRIPAEIEDAINSDQPGELRAKVRRDVYDTITGKYLLIPANSHLVGEYNSSVSYGQNRVQVVWTRLIFPDGTSLNLGRMNGHGADGTTGLKDQTDNHWKRTLAGAALSSLLSAGLQISQNRGGNSSVLTYPTTGQVAASAIGQHAAELGQRITERNLNVQPTLKMRPGLFFVVFVKKDIAFDSPYTARTASMSGRQQF